MITRSSSERWLITSSLVFPVPDRCHACVLLRLAVCSQDCSSVNTFRGVSKILETSKPLTFILENVDSLDSPNQEDDRELLGSS